MPSAFFRHLPAAIISVVAPAAARFVASSPVTGTISLSFCLFTGIHIAAAIVAAVIAAIVTAVIAAIVAAVIAAIVTAIVTAVITAIIAAIIVAVIAAVIAAVITAVTADIAAAVTAVIIAVVIAAAAVVIAVTITVSIAVAVIFIMIAAAIVAAPGTEIKTSHIKNTSFTRICFIIWGRRQDVNISADYGTSPKGRGHRLPDRNFGRSPASHFPVPPGGRPFS